MGRGLSDETKKQIEKALSKQFDETGTPTIVVRLKAKKELSLEEFKDIVKKALPDSVDDAVAYGMKYGLVPPDGKGYSVVNSMKYVVNFFVTQFDNWKNGKVVEKCEKVVEVEEEVKSTPAPTAVPATKRGRKPKTAAVEAETKETPKVDNKTESDPDPCIKTILNMLQRIDDRITDQNHSVAMAWAIGFNNANGPFTHENVNLDDLNAKYDFGNLPTKGDASEAIEFYTYNVRKSCTVDNLLSFVSQVFSYSKSEVVKDLGKLSIQDIRNILIPKAKIK
jgi:hypothetical protein